MNKIFLLTFIFILFASISVAEPYIQTLKNGNIEKTYDTGTQADWDSIINDLDRVNIGNNDYEIAVYGTYHPTRPIMWKKSGTPDHPIKIVGKYQNRGSGFDGNSIDVSNYPNSISRYGSPVLFVEDISYLSIENLHFSNFSHFNPSHTRYDQCDGWERRIALRFYRSTYNTVKNCLFHNFFGVAADAAISFQENCYHNIVESCEFNSLKAETGHLHAVYLNEHSSNNIILNNHVSYCSGSTFFVRHHSNHNVFDGNVVDSCASDAFYNAWHDMNRGEIPCSSNVVRNAICTQPSQNTTIYRRYSNGNYIRKFRNINNDIHYSCFPDSINISSDFFNPNMPLYMPEDHNNKFVTVNPELVVNKDAVIGEDPAYFSFNDGEGIFKAHVYLNEYNKFFTETTFAEPTKFYLNNLGDTIWTDISTVAKIKIELIDEQADIKPRIFDKPVYLRTVQGDTIDSMHLERWIVKKESTPEVYLIEGADQRIEFNLTELSEDYDLFLLEGAVYDSVQWHLNNDLNAAWNYCTENALAQSAESGVNKENFVYILEEGKEYCTVVSPKPNINPTTQYTLRIVPIEKKSPK